MNLSLSQIGGSLRFFANEYFDDFRIKNNFRAESEIVSEIKIFRRKISPVVIQPQGFFILRKHARSKGAKTHLLRACFRILGKPY